jgi:hypothetical protein
LRPNEGFFEENVYKAENILQFKIIVQSCMIIKVAVFESFKNFVFLDLACFFGLAYKTKTALRRISNHRHDNSYQIPSGIRVCQSFFINDLKHNFK